MLKIKSKNQDSFEFPLIGYAGYAITKLFSSVKPLSYLLDRLETMVLHHAINKIFIDRPVYITGLARAGTSIILEMLSKHPDLASHQYKHLLMPYIPHWINYIVQFTRFYSQPIERLHADGIYITRDSPEAVEEKFWQTFFENCHNENTSNIISKDISNPKFELFYQNHIKKLINSQNSSRYLAKNNYNVTRLEYLLRLFPDSKFLVIIRNPVDHIASLIKQTQLYMRMEKDVPLLIDWLKILGHHEFGHFQVCINVGNTELIYKIRKLWRDKKTYVKGWAYYWNSIYEFIANKLDKNKELKKATYVVNYDKLCETPDRIIDNILKHAELPINSFEQTKKYYVNHLHLPTYYTPNFTPLDFEYIYEVTKGTASRFGLSFPKT
ncbi:MAG: sulfotransferase [Promethearchaeota archaeon]